MGPGASSAERRHLGQEVAELVLKSPPLLLVALLLAVLPFSAAQDACMLGPWQAGGGVPAYATRSVQVASWGDLQQYVDQAAGPTVLVVRALKQPLSAARTLVVSKPDIVITTATSYDPTGATFAGPSIRVKCGAAKTAVAIKASGVVLQGFNITGCTTSAVSVASPVAARAVVLSDLDLVANEGMTGAGIYATRGALVLRRCALIENSARDAGGGVYAAGTAVWVDTCDMQRNGAAAGGAVAVNGGRLLVSGSHLFDNIADGLGGGLMVRGATLPAGGCWGAPSIGVRVMSSNISGNAADNGGGIGVLQSALVAQDVQMWNNGALNQGGAIAAAGAGAVNLTAVVMDSNRARNGGGLHLSDAGRLIFEGVTAHNNTATAAGGVLYVNGSGSSVLLSNSLFDYNWAKLLGGVATIKDGNTVNIWRSNFTRNEAEMAAGVLYGRYINVTVEQSRFALNWAGRDGGALYCAGFCDWQIRASNFFNNTCPQNGGAIFGWNMAANVTASSFDINAANALGGAISMANSTIVIEGCKLYGNQATGTDAAGGAIYSQFSTWSVLNCDLQQNLAPWGGGVYLVNSTLSVLDTLIANNSAFSSGAGVHVLNSEAVLTTTVMHDNLARLHAGSLYCQASDCTVEEGNFFNESSKGGAGSVFATSGNLTLMFTNITGGFAGSSEGGGGVLLRAAKLRMRGCRIAENSALDGPGGGLQLDNVKEAFVDSSSFEANKAAQGGAIAAIASVLALRRSSVRANEASVGGGVALLGGSRALLNSTDVAGNRAAVGGGAASDNSTFAMTQGSVAGNDARWLLNTGRTYTFGGQPTLAGLGGGVFSRGGALEITSADVAHNRAEAHGGGAYADNARLAATNAHFVNNTAGGEGGAVKLANAQPRSRVEAGAFHNNTAAAGGALAVVTLSIGTDLELTACLFKNNTAAQLGGGAVRAAGPMALLIQGGEMAANRARGGGGAVLAEGAKSVRVRGARLTGNRAGGVGGALAADDCGDVLLEDTAIESNAALSGGGAALVEGHSSVAVRNCTVRGNAATGQTAGPVVDCSVGGTGGGLCIDADCPVLLNSSVISNNVAENGGALALSLCSDLKLCTLSMGRMTFSNNTALRGGGGAVFLGSPLEPSQLVCNASADAVFQASSAEAGSVSSVASNLRLESMDVDSRIMAAAAAAAAANGLGHGRASPAPAAPGAGGGAAGAAAAASAGTATVVTPAGPEEDDVVSSTGGYDPTAGGGGAAAGAGADPGASVTTASFDPEGAGGGSGGSVLIDTASSGGATTTSVGGGGAAAARESGGKSSQGLAAALPESAQVEAKAAAPAPAAPSAQGNKLLEVGLAPAKAIGTAKGAQPPSPSPPPPARSPPVSAPLAQSPAPAAPREHEALPASGSHGASTVEMPTATTTFVPGSYSDGDFTASTVTFESAAMPQGATFETAAVEPNDAVFESAAVEPSSFKASSSGGGDASGVSEAGARPSTVKAASGAASSFDEAEAGEYEDDITTGTAAVAPGGAAAGPSRSLKFSIPKFASSDAAHALWRRSRAAASAAAAAATAAVRPRAPPPPPPQPQRLLPLVPLDDEVSAELERAGVTKWAIDQMRARGGVEPALYRAMATGQGQQQQAAPTSWARAQAPRTFGGPSAPSMGISAPAFEGAAAAEAGCAAGSSCRRSRGSFGGVGEAVRSQAADDWRLGAEQPHSPFGDEELAGEGATVADLLQPPPPPPRQQQGYELQQQRQQQQQQQQGYEQPQGYEQQPDYGEALQHPVHSTWAAPQPVQEAFEEPGEPSSRRRARRRRVLLADAVPTAASTGASGGNMLEIGACGAYDGNRAQGAGSYGPVVAGVPAGVRLQYPSMEAAPGEPMRVRALIIDAFGHVVASGPSSFMRVWASLDRPAAQPAAGGVPDGLAARRRLLAANGTAAGGKAGAGAAAAGKPANATAKAASGSGSGGAAANATRAAANTTGKAAPAVKAAPAGKAAAGANGSAAAPRPAAGVRLAGTTTAIVLGGVATFRGLEVVGPVNGTVTVWLSAVGAQGRASAAPLAVRLRACEAGAVLTRADGCRTCGPGSFSFDPKASECGTCPPGAWCNGTVVAPLPGAWHSSPRSTQVHACLNPAACARTAAQQQAIIDEQREGFSTVLSVAADPGAVREYEQMLCAPGYAGRLCGQCGEIGGEMLGKVGAARCERCAGHGATIGLWVLARLFDLVMLGALIWLSLRAARAWGRYTPDADGGAADPAAVARRVMAARRAGSGAAAAAAAAAGGDPWKGEGALTAPGAVGRVTAAGLGPEPPLLAHVDVLLDLFHLTSILGASGMVYTWPRALQRFNAALSLTPLGTSRWVPLDCALADRAWLPRSMAALLAVALPALVYVGLAFAAWAASMRVEVPRVGAKPLIVLMATAGLYYPLLTWSALSTLQCVPLDGPAPPGQAALARGAFWALDTGVRCWHGPHLGLALGFGLPVLVAVGAGWLALLAALLRHCRDRLRRRADTAAPAQPRRRRRRGLVHCQQALGVGAGYLRPRRYQWAVVAEGRRFALLALLAAMAPATALAQAYALWGVLAAFLVAEGVARPYSTWALLALQFVVLGAVQGTVYLGSAFAQQGGAFALAGAADAVTALVIILNVGAVVAFLLSLLPGLRRGALLQLLDGDGDGKVTARDLAAFAADLLRGKGGGSGGGGGGGGDAGGAAGGLRASVVRALEKVAARPAGTVVARPDLDQGEGDQDAARPGSRVGSASGGVAPAAAAAAALGQLSRAGSAAAALGSRPGSAGGVQRGGGASEHVGLDVRTLAAATSAHSLPAHVGAGVRAGSSGQLYAANGMPLQSFMSVNKWLEESEHDAPGEPRRGPGGRPPSGPGRRGSGAAAGGGGALRGAASTPTGQLPSIQSGQRRALLQQLHDWREEDLERGAAAAAAGGRRRGRGGDGDSAAGDGSESGSGSGSSSRDDDGDSAGRGGRGRRGEARPSLSSYPLPDSDDELRSRPRARRAGSDADGAGSGGPPSLTRTGSLAARRLAEVQRMAAAATAAGEDQPATGRHSAYYSLWQAAAGGGADAAAAVLAPESVDAPPSSDDPMAAAVAEAAQQAAAAAAARPRQRPNPFAAAGMLAAAATAPPPAPPSPTSAAAAAAAVAAAGAAAAAANEAAAGGGGGYAGSARSVDTSAFSAVDDRVVAEAAQQAAAAVAARPKGRPSPFAAAAAASASSGSAASGAAQAAPAAAPAASAPVAIPSTQAAEGASVAPSSVAASYGASVGTPAAADDHMAALVAEAAQQAAAAAASRPQRRPNPFAAPGAFAPAAALPPAAPAPPAAAAAANGAPGAQQQAPPLPAGGRHRQAYSMWLGVAGQIAAQEGSVPTPPAGPGAATAPATPAPTPPFALPAAQDSKGSSGSGSGAAPTVVADVAMRSMGSGGSGKMPWAPGRKRPVLRAKRSYES